MSRSRIASLACSAFLMITLASSGAWAQFSSGLTGTVYDPSGAVVPDASVTLKEGSTGVEHSTKTSSAGIYRFTALPASTFVLSVKAGGFEPASLSDISIQVAETRSLDVTLKLGAATTEVNVTAQVAQVSTTQAEVSGQVGETKVHELPLVGRNMYSLVVLTPGVTGVPGGAGQAYAQATSDIFNAELGVNLNANGQRAESNNFLVDGANTNGNPRGGVTNLTPNADSIQEVRIQTNTFDAQYGRNAAAIVNVVTKSGSNQVHGSLSEFYTSTGFNSRTIFQPKSPSFVRNEFGASVGGPIRKDRDFYFGSVDILRSGVGFARNATVPTQDLINYLKANQSGNISTQVLSSFPTGFQANRDFATAGSTLGVDCATLASASTAIATPVGMMPCNMNVKGAGDFSTTIFRNGVQWNARVDHSWNDFKDRLYGNFYRTTRQTVNFADPSPYFPAFSPAEPEYTHLLNINWTHSMGSSFVNQMTVAYTRTFGDSPCDHCEVPAVGTDDGVELPGNGFIGLFRQNNYEWKDVATLLHGRHNFKFGANIARHHDDESFNDTTTRPTFQFANILEYAADNPYSEGNVQFDPKTGQVGTVNVDFAYRDTDIGAFLQDDIKLRPNFTLNLGVRWEVFTGPTERFGRQNNAQFPLSGPFDTQITNLRMVGVPQLWHTRMDQFAPRFGFAWDPSGKGKMSVRGGIGEFYDRPANQLFTGNRNNLPLIANTTVSIFNPPALPVYGLGASGTTPFNFPQPSNIAFGLDGKNGLLNARAGQVITDPHLQTQYGINWSFGIQYELFSNWVAEADYIGSNGHHLYSSYDVNVFAGDLITDSIRDRLNSSFGSLGYGQANYNSAYNGGTVAIRNRGFTKGINFQAAYTFGKAIDQSNTFGVAPVDRSRLDLERGLADFNVARRLSFSTLWRVPSINSSSPLANIFLKGWQVSNITILQTGTPFTVFCGSSILSGCDFNGDGVNNDRPNEATFGNAINGSTKQDFLNGLFACDPNVSLCSNVFSLPSVGTIGSLGRNTFTGPGYINTDFSAIKKTHIPWFVKEGANLEFRAEFFNVFNHVNLRSISSNISSGSFGRATGAFPARDIQFGLRIEY
jgi:Carboxypeptidase regulatory-like domain/TonB dependent receptor-like, beta-barrel